jgi:hypothetical protein
LAKEKLAMYARRGIAALALVWVLLPSAPVRADDAEDKAVTVVETTIE